MLVACMERTLKSTAPWDRNTHIIPLSISVKCLCIAVLFNGHDYQNLSKDKQRDVLAEVITQGVENRNPPSSIKMLNCCDNSELETEEGNMDIEIYFWYLTFHSRGLKYSHLCIFAGVLWHVFSKTTLMYLSVYPLANFTLRATKVVKFGGHDTNHRWPPMRYFLSINEIESFKIAHSGRVLILRRSDHRESLFWNGRMIGSVRMWKYYATFFVSRGFNCLIV